MATVHGKNARVYLQGSGSEAVQVSEANEWTFDFGADFSIDNAFGDTWESNLKGLNKFSATVAGNFDTAQSVMFDAINATSERKLYLYPDASTPTRYYYATVWPTMSGTMPIGGTAKFALQLKGASNYLANN